jgi:hypothetical protein
MGDTIRTNAAFCLSGSLFRQPIDLQWQMKRFQRRMNFPRSLLITDASQMSWIIAIDRLLTVDRPRCSFTHSSLYLFCKFDNENEIQWYYYDCEKCISIIHIRDAELLHTIYCTIRETPAIHNFINNHLDGSLIIVSHNVLTLEIIDQ